VTEAPRRMVLNLREHRPIWSIPDRAVEELRDALPAGWELVSVDEPADGRGDGAGTGTLSRELVDAVRGAEIYVGFGIREPVFAAAAAAGRLRWVHSAAAGAAGSLHPPMLASEVVLTNAAGVYAEPVADTVMAMALHFTRGLDFAVRAQAERRWWKAPWEAADTPVRELADLTVGIVGLGGIGAAVARRATALGMRVVATRRGSSGGPAGVELLAGDGALQALLARSDLLVVAVPLTPATRGMIGAAEILSLPPGAVVVNVARGEVVDEAALAAALVAGRLRGAGLDVFAREPLPEDSPLWSLPNVLITPHVSGTSHGFWRRQLDLIRDNLERHLTGRPLLNRVDKAAGY
jgi:phosphoglycerate dehydrogenase-like enzyme